MLVPDGQFKDNIFWGQFMAQISDKFTPHGFAILIDPNQKILQLGTFKNGKEFGQQRVIVSEPVKHRYFTQFTSVNGVLQGPALIERSNGRVEVGNY